MTGTANPLGGAVNAVGGVLGKGLGTARKVTQTVVVAPAKAVVQQTNKVVQGVTQTVTGKSSSQNAGQASVGGTQGVTAADAQALSTQSALPPDEQIMAMDILFTKMLANVSPTQWFDNFWNSQETYEQVFAAAGKQDIVITPWEEGEGESLQNPYDEEMYSHRRTVEFHFEKTIMGQQLQPQVKTVEHARASEDRCIVTLSSDCTGVPFGDAFQVQLRWVGTRVEQNDLLLQLGIFVLFKKSVFVAGQIRSASKSESTDEQMKTFEAMKTACGAEESTAQMEVEPIEEETGEARRSTTLCNTKNFPLLDLLPFCGGQERTLPPFQDDLDRTLYEIQQMLQTLSNSQPVDAQRPALHEALEMANDALDAILVRKFDLEESSPPTTEEETKSLASSIMKTSLVRTLVSPVEQVNSVFVRPVAKASKRAKKLAFSPFLSPKNNEKKPRWSSESRATKYPRVDTGLDRMDVVLNRTLQATLDDMYELLFGSDQNPDTWRNKAGQANIVLGEWEEPPKDQPFIDPWSKESYPEKRSMSFESPRACSSFFTQEDYQAVVKVRQTQYRRRDPHKIVFAATERNTGAYYSKSIQIFRRLVVTEIGEGKISLKAGVFVMFTRPELMESKIRATEIHETTKRSTELFRSFRASLAGKAVEQSVKERYEFKNAGGEPSIFHSLVDGIRLALPFAQSLQDDPEFHDIIQSVRGKVNMVEELLDNREANSMEDLNFYDGELLVAREALDNVMTPEL